MRRKLPVLCTIVPLLVLAGCSSSAGNLVDSFRMPGTVSFVFDKGAVLAMNGGPDLRATLEDAIIAQAGRARLVAAHTVLTADDMSSAAAVREKLLSQGFDGVVAMRVVRETEVNPFESVRGETLMSYAASVPPGEPAFGKGVMRVEAVVFRLDDAAPVWGGMVEVPATDPQTVAKDATKVIMRELRATGLVHD